MTAWDVDTVVERVAEVFGVPEAEIRGESRRQDVAWARQVVFYVLSRYGHVSLAEIGRRLGRDHSTVHHGARRVEETVRQSALERAAVLDVISPMAAVGRGQHQVIAAVETALGEARAVVRDLEAMQARLRGELSVVA